MEEEARRAVFEPPGPALVHMASLRKDAARGPLVQAVMGRLERLPVAVGHVGHPVDRAEYRHHVQAQDEEPGHGVGEDVCPGEIMQLMRQGNARENGVGEAVLVRGEEQPGRAFRPA